MSCPVRSWRAVSVAQAKAGARKAACRLTHALNDRSWPLTTRSMTTQLRYGVLILGPETKRKAETAHR